MTELENIRDKVRYAKNGDNDAIAYLYTKFRNSGMNVAKKYMKNENDAEDMYQDSFLKAMEHLNDFDESRDFGPWFNTIIANTSKNQLARKKATNFTDMSDDESDFVDTLANTDSEVVPELSYDRKEFMSIVEGLVNELPQAQKEALTLFYYKEMSVKDIAKLQDVPEDTVKSRLNYSRKKMESKIDDYEKRTGIKLSGAMLVPLLFIMFYKSSAYAAEAEAILSASAGATVAGGASGGATASGMTDSSIKMVKSASVSSAKTDAAVRTASAMGTAIKTSALYKLAIASAVLVLSGTTILFAIKSHSTHDDKRDLIVEENVSTVDEESTNNEVASKTHSEEQAKEENKSDKETIKEQMPANTKNENEAEDDTYVFTKESFGSWQLTQLFAQKNGIPTNFQLAGHIAGGSQVSKTLYTITFDQLHIWTISADEYDSRHISSEEMESLGWGKWNKKGFGYADEGVAQPGIYYQFLGDAAYNLDVRSNAIDTLPPNAEDCYFVLEISSGVVTGMKPIKTFSIGEEGYDYYGEWDPESHTFNVIRQ